MTLTWCVINTLSLSAPFYQWFYLSASPGRIWVWLTPLILLFGSAVVGAFIYVYYKCRRNRSVFTAPESILVRLSLFFTSWIFYKIYNKNCFSFILFFTIIIICNRCHTVKLRFYLRFHKTTENRFLTI